MNPDCTDPNCLCHDTLYHFYPERAEFDYARSIEVLVHERNQDWARKPWVAIVASQGWADLDYLDRYIDGLAAKYPGTTIILPDRPGGAQSAVVERVSLQGFKTITVNGDGGGTAVKAGYMIRLADVVVCFWNGGADIAKDAIDKAVAVHRPLPQFGQGLHIHEAVKARAHKKAKETSTGRIRYRIRNEKKLNGKISERLMEPEKRAA